VSCCAKCPICPHSLFTVSELNTYLSGTSQTCEVRWPALDFTSTGKGWAPFRHTTVVMVASLLQKNHHYILSVCLPQCSLQASFITYPKLSGGIGNLCPLAVSQLPNIPVILLHTYMSHGKMAALCVCLRAGAIYLFSGLLQVDSVALPAAVQTRPRLPETGGEAKG
jgi:hypothetical protein